MSESAFSNDDDNGFRRGFLLRKSTRAKGCEGKIQPPKSDDPLPSKSSKATKLSKSASSPPLLEQATAAVKCKGSDTKKAKQTSSATRAPAKKDSGWAKGFLNNNKKKKSYTTGKGGVSNEGSRVRKSKAHIPIATASNEKSSDWSRGFLTNKNANKNNNKIKDGQKRNLSNDNYYSKRETGKKEQSSPRGNYPKATRSSDLLSIDNDGDRNSRNAVQIHYSADTTPKITSTTGNEKSLISVVFDDSTNENASSQDLLQLEPTADFNERRIENNVKGASKKLTTENLTTPLLSIVREDDDYCHEKPSSIFIKEISTRRKPNHESGKQPELAGVREGGNTLLTENMKDETSCHKPTTVCRIPSTDLSNKNEKKDEAPLSFRDDGGNNSILEFQQDLERLFSRPPKLSPHEECVDRKKGDDLQSIYMRFRTPENRRHAWIYLLQQRQQRQYGYKYTIEAARGGSECDYMIRELFDAELFHQRQQQHKKIIRDCDNGDDVEIPLGSILQCVETQQDRRMALHATLVIEEYFLFRYNEQERNQRHEIRQKSRSITVKNAQLERTRLLTPLFERLTLLSSGNQRTLLIQTAWKTAILLFCFCIRQSSGESSSSFSTVPAFFLEKLDSLLYQQLIWQQSKSKPNAEKIIQLQGMKTKSENILKSRNTQQREFNASLELLQELVVDLEKLIGL